MIFNITENSQLTLPSHIVAIEYALITLTFITLGITVFAAYKRLHYSRRFTLVALLNILSFCAIIGLISDIKIKTQTEMSAVLLTYGTSQQQIESIPIDDNTQIFLLSSLPNWQASLDLSTLTKPLLIDNVGEILLYQPQITQLSVYGDGLATQQWQMLDTLINATVDEDSSEQHLHVNFYPSNIRTGPTNLIWPKQLILGQPFYITGTFSAQSEDEKRIFKISLSDAYDEVVDEFLIKHNERFNLSASLKSQGLFTYQLKVFDDDQTLLMSEPVSFNVTSAEKIKVVIKQSAASFESKHLKNWLAEQGEEVLVFTQVSKNKYIQQVVNATSDVEAISKVNKADKSTINMIEKMFTSTWLKDIDLLYMDGRAVLSLKKDEIEQVEIAIKNGLGLIIIVDDELLLSSNEVLSHSLLAHVYPQEGWPLNTKVNQGLTTIPRWLRSKDEHTLPYTNAILPKANGEVLIEGNDGQALSVTHNYGLGSATFSLINSSYQWLTSDNKSHYSRYWQYIIEKTARSEQESGWQKPPTERIYFQGENQRICAQLNESGVTNLQIKNINLLPSIVIDSAYCGVYLSDYLGWHNFTLTNKKSALNQENTRDSLQNNRDLNTQSVFIYSQQNWLTWQQLLKHEASNVAYKNSTKIESKVSYSPIDKLTFWWLLFISSSLLWYERKIF